MTLDKLSSAFIGPHYAACDHLGIFTKNAKRLADFYIDTLGFKREKEERLSASLMKTVLGMNSDCIMIRLVSGGVKLELFQPVSIRLVKRLNITTGYNHWGYQVGDREKCVRRLKRKGIHIFEVQRNGHRVYFVKDPDGNRIEIRT